MTRLNDSGGGGGGGVRPLPGPLYRGSPENADVGFGLRHPCCLCACVRESGKEMRRMGMRRLLVWLKGITVTYANYVWDQDKHAHTASSYAHGHTT